MLRETKEKKEVLSEESLVGVKQIFITPSGVVVGPSTMQLGNKVLREF